MKKPIKKSAGILLYRKNREQVEVMLVHPGGPFWKNKDTGAWSIPKGEFEEGEEPMEAAKREFLEETGKVVLGNFQALMPVKLKSGKIIYAWAVEGDIDISDAKSNTFLLEWPPKSGKKVEMPEIDMYGWFELSLAMLKITESQKPLLLELQDLIITAS